MTIYYHIFLFYQLLQFYFTFYYNQEFGEKEKTIQKLAQAKNLYCLGGFYMLFWKDILLKNFGSHYDNFAHTSGKCTVTQKRNVIFAVIEKKYILAI